MLSQKRVCKKKRKTIRARRRNKWVTWFRKRNKPRFRRARAFKLRGRLKLLSHIKTGYIRNEVVRELLKIAL